MASSNPSLAILSRSCLLAFFKPSLVLSIFSKALFSIDGDCSSLSGELAGRHRLRTGDYRVQFSVAGDVVTVERIGHRSRFYEG
jgi:mRNA-degrading endonuclease RelE of RelBE toxin-antitoxin system